MSVQQITEDVTTTQLVPTTTEVSHVPVTQDSLEMESPALVSKKNYVVCTASSTLN